jgi:hypothetical protein
MLEPITPICDVGLASSLTFPSWSWCIVTDYL